MICSHVSSFNHRATASEGGERGEGGGEEARLTPSREKEKKEKRERGSSPATLLFASHAPGEGGEIGKKKKKIAFRPLPLQERGKVGEKKKGGRQPP